MYTYTDFLALNLFLCTIVQIILSGTRQNVGTFREIDDGGKNGPGLLRTSTQRDPGSVGKSYQLRSDTLI